MAKITVSLSDEDLRRLEELGGREGDPIDQLAHAGIRKLLGLPDEAFRQAAHRVLEQNAELYRRLA